MRSVNLIGPDGIENPVRLGEKPVKRSGILDPSVQEIPNRDADPDRYRLWAATQARRA